MSGVFKKKNKFKPGDYVQIIQSTYDDYKDQVCVVVSGADVLKIKFLNPNCIYYEADGYHIIHEDWLKIYKPKLKCPKYLR